MNGKDIRLSYTNLRGILDGKRTIHYESISDILISMFSGINKFSQGRNIFVIDFGSSRYQKFVISLICVSAEFPAYNDEAEPQDQGQRQYHPWCEQTHSVTPGESPGYDWRKLDPLHRAPTRPCEVTPGEPATMSRYEAFRFRIRRCRREILRIRKLMKLRIFDIETNRNQ